MCSAQENTTLILKIYLVFSSEVALEWSWFQSYVLDMYFMGVVADIWTFPGTLWLVSLWDPFEKYNAQEIIGPVRPIGVDRKHLNSVYCWTYIGNWFSQFSCEMCKNKILLCNRSFETYIQKLVTEYFVLKHFYADNFNV